MYQVKRFIWSSHTQIVEILTKSRSQKILDLGCDEGFIGQCLKYTPSKMIGVDKESKIFLPSVYQKFICLDIEEGLNKNIKGKFDAIILADILEHLKLVEKVISDCKLLLGKKGFMVISVPNMGFLLARILDFFHFKLKMEKGLFDKSHLNDFTYYKLVNLIQKNNLKIDQLVATPVPLPLISPLFDNNHKLYFIYKFFNFLAKKYPRLFAYQLIVKIRA